MAITHHVYNVFLNNVGKCWRDQWAHTRRGAHLASLIPLPAVTEALLRDETYRGKILTEDPVVSWPRKRTLEENLVKSGESGGR